MNQQDVIDRLRAAIEAAGSQAAFAEKHKISLQYVNDVLRGRREPGKLILEALGIERITLYREKLDNVAGERGENSEDRTPKL